MSKTTDFYSQQSPEVSINQLQSKRKIGLSEKQVRDRLEEYGLNEVQATEESVLKRLMKRFWGPIPWMIEAAALLSASAQKWEDFSIIIVMLLVNAVLDFLQEHRALNALKVLKHNLETETHVLRNGKFQTIPSKYLVPGDIIELKIGDRVPADVQLIDGEYLLLDESALTGESLPVSKETGQVAYTNTLVKQGQMQAIVVNTATKTRFHSVVALITKTQQKETSHFQKMVLKIGHFLIGFTLLLAIIIVLVALRNGDPFSEILQFVLVLTVASIPVALPAVLSVTMAVGAMNLAKKQAIVSKLTAIEEMAGIDIFCSDKTGTLTQNKMQISDPILLPGYELDTLFLNAIMASKETNRDPIEIPIFDYAQKSFPELLSSLPEQSSFTPFNPHDKYTKGGYQKNGNHYIALKGAPQVIFKLCNLSPEGLEQMLKQVDELAAHGYRTLAIARQSEMQIELIGLLPLYDPPREDSKDTIDRMESHGVQVKMITGDNLAIAREIGKLLGLKGAGIQASKLSGGGGQTLLELAQVLTQSIYQNLKQDVTHTEAGQFADKVIQQLKEMYDTRLLDREFIYQHESAIVELIESTEIFAEVIPEDKYRIVDTLQKGGHIVGMTGDGVNDAPALKKADCGIAVSGATDVARASADIILTQPGLSVINDAIIQSRETFKRMQTYATFRIAETIRLILFITLAISVFNFYPITAIMVILLALLNDIPILTLAYDHVKSNGTPVRWQMKRLLTLSTVLGISGVISSFLLFLILEAEGFEQDIIQTMIFLKLVVAGHMTLWILRNDGWFWEKPYPSPLLLGAILTTEIIGTLFAVYGLFVTAIGWEMALLVWSYAIAWMLINNAVKIVTVKLLNRYQKEETEKPSAAFSQ
ncbi:plasma-membrane proton-efflux P-type ATPase [Thiomicrorhabdus xiamenensis]|uniref:HAD-IC family P-type ATPase n=1 Tax=Thiomicrorhabdus xiamenensis TaxID=2739063 RepID=A0A7D4T1F2_9GAMM|nr:plasma-membrane proton-efflux P-type ATPase [Thiomicrorhabdus xiamenensis]QKI89505.1 HAD-IC family P-type ATPase [Thiomicrorhabdus xiamenensis]